MNVWDNVAFGLRYTNATKDETQAAGRRGAGPGRDGAASKQKPLTLSGGQQQRVALARALVLGPEGPAARRAARRAGRQAAQDPADPAQGPPGAGRHHLRLRHPRPGGGADDVGPPRRDGRRPDRAGGHPDRRLPAEPASAYVADFLGVSNLLDVDVLETGDRRGGGAVRRADAALHYRRRPRRGTGQGGAAARSASALLPSEDQGANRVPGMVERCVYLGSTTQVFVRLAPGASVQAMVPNSQGVADVGAGRPGQRPPARRTPSACCLPDRAAAGVAPRPGPLEAELAGRPGASPPGSPLRGSPWGPPAPPGRRARPAAPVSTSAELVDVDRGELAAARRQPARSRRPCRASAGRAPRGRARPRGGARPAPTGRATAATSPGSPSIDVVRQLIRTSASSLSRAPSMASSRRATSA